MQSSNYFTRKVGKLKKYSELFCLLLIILLVLTPKCWNRDSESKPKPKRYFVTSAREPCITGLSGPVLTFYTSTRLGNQMYGYATLFAEVHKVNHTRKGFIHPLMSEYLAEYFKITLPVLKNDDFEAVNWTMHYIDDGHPTTLSLPEDIPCLRLGCYPQQWQLFESVRPQILQEFTFHKHILRECARLRAYVSNHYFGPTFEKKVTFIGIHVRRGDYVEHTKGMGLHLPELAYYSGAMKYTAQKYENSIFIITSDDIRYCKTIFASVKLLYRIYYMERTEEEGGLDMALLSSCDHVIFGLGTFGFWAAYLNKGEKIYCNCSKEDSVLKEYHKFVPPKWTALSVNGSLIK